MVTTGAPDDGERHKQAAAHAAVALLRSGMRVGLGTGSTALHATRRIAALLRSGALTGVQAIATSEATAAHARRLAIPLAADDLQDDLDVTIDGADEIDDALNLIKGGGGALLREKIVAQASRRLVVVADAAKRSPRLGTRRAVPVEVIAFGWRSQARFLEALGARVVLRLALDGAPWRTDSNNLVLDCWFGPIADPARLAAILLARAGVVEHGLFIGLAHDVMLGSADGVQHITVSRPT